MITVERLVSRVGRNGRVLSACDRKPYTLTKWSKVKDFMKKDA